MFCFNSVLSYNDFGNHIKNNFHKYGLYSLDPDTEDYTKCVLNQREKLSSKSPKRKSGEHFPDFHTAEKVVNKIRDKLTFYGINVDVIVNEIHALELTSPKNPKKSVEVEINKSLVNSSGAESNISKKLFQVEPDIVDKII